MNNTLIDLRTHEQKLIGRLDPATLTLHVRQRGKECVFDLQRIASAANVGDDLIIVRSGARAQDDDAKLDKMSEGLVSSVGIIEIRHIV